MSKTDPKPPAADKRPRLDLHRKPDGIAVWFDPASNPGAKSFGQLKPGTEYVVAPDEALRLVRVKGFAYVTDADEKRGKAHAIRVAESNAEKTPADPPADATPTAPAASPAATIPQE